MQSIGRYELLEKLGQGGMGIVYRARDTLLERIVAVKVISAPIEENTELRERFFREARSAGQLSHKNIITIHDLGEHDSQPYLAMEYLEGQDLLARMAGPQRMSLRRRVEIATEICEGLDYAHVHGVVHRDIKPANIFITDAGTVKILDFGLARLVTSELTRSNMMMGTINYMAPEQIRGERVDHRGDVFSTSVVLYELLSGRRAFEADSFAATLYKILQEVPEPLQHIDPTIHPELIRIVERGLAKPRDERYQHMSEMLLDLAVYRQQLAALDSPAAGRVAPSELRTPSDRPYAVTPALPLPPMASPATPAIGTAAPPPAAPLSGVAPGGRLRSLVLPIIAFLALGIAGTAMWKATRPHATEPGDAPATAAVPATPISEMMRAALAAFEAEDYASAGRGADAVLLRDPGNDGATRLRDRARQSAAAVDGGLTKARALFEKGQFEEASRAAGEVLSVAPGNQEAKRLMEDGALRSRGQGADKARTQVARARAAARSAGAQRLASGSFLAASAAEREAQRLSDAGRAGEATVKLYEASGLYRSAEISAQNEAAARDAMARADRTPPETARGSGAGAESAVVPAPPAAPTSPVETREPARVPTPTPLTPEVIPTGPPPAPAPAAAPGPTAEALAAARDAAIGDVLGRYKSALESRNLEALRRLWPGLTASAQEALRIEFQRASRISVDIVDPRITSTSDTATVTFIRRYEVLTVEGQRLQSESHATMDLRRNGASWIIERIRFDLRR
jgi:serine/threonine-protein kinase